MPLHSHSCISLCSCFVILFENKMFSGSEIFDPGNPLSLCLSLSRGMATTRYRSLVERGRSKTFVRDKGLTHTVTQKGNKKMSQKTQHSPILKKIEHIELLAELLDYFLPSNKNNINLSPTLLPPLFWCQIMMSSYFPGLKSTFSIRQKF